MSRFAEIGILVLQRKVCGLLLAWRKWPVTLAMKPTSHSEGALSLREVGPSSGPPCWASGQFTFQTEDRRTVVCSGDWGGAGSTVEGAKASQSRLERKRDHFCLTSRRKTTPETTLMSLFGRDPKCSHITIACEHLLCLFGWLV